MRAAGTERLAQALRRLRRDWAFTAAFVVTLALGIAANAAVFSAIDAYFLRPLPYPDARRLVDIYFDAARYPLPAGSAMSSAGYQGLRSARLLAASGLERDRNDVLVAFPGEVPQYLPVAAVTASTFRTLDVQPVLGRWISAAADRAGGPDEVDLGYRLWRSAFHGDPHVPGRVLRIRGKPYTVVGVMPPGFAFPARHNQLWTSAGLTPEELGPQELTTFNWTMIARLQPGSSRAELDAELADVLTRLERSMPQDERALFQRVGGYVTFMPWRQWLGGATRGLLLMMQIPARGAGKLDLVAQIRPE